MKSDFLVWRHKIVPHMCSLYEVLNIEKEYQLMKGVLRADDFPKDAAFRMHPDRPNDTILLDSLYNTDDLIVISSRLKGFLEERKLKSVEYLPVTILNHKNKPFSNDYFILHPIDLPECLDIKKSKPTWGIVVKDQVDRVKQLIIDPAEIEPERELFRPKPFYYAVVVRRSLAEAIVAAGFTGIRWVDAEDFPHPIKKRT